MASRALQGSHVYEPLFLLLITHFPLNSYTKTAIDTLKISAVFCLFFISLKQLMYVIILPPVTLVTTASSNQKNVASILREKKSSNKRAFCWQKVNKQLKTAAFCWITNPPYLRHSTKEHHLFSNVTVSNQPIALVRFARSRVPCPRSLVWLAVPSLSALVHWRACYAYADLRQYKQMLTLWYLKLVDD